MIAHHGSRGDRGQVGGQSGYGHPEGDWLVHDLLKTRAENRNRFSGLTDFLKHRARLWTLIYSSLIDKRFHRCKWMENGE